MKVEINLKNCFGIGSLEHIFDFSKSNINLIYAPNGTMKTSFAKTFECIAKKDPDNLPRDLIHQNVETQHQILLDGEPINPEQILVINGENENPNVSESISTFLAKEELKTKYDEIYSELDKAKKQFIRELKAISGSNDCDIELENTFLSDKDENFFDIILKLQRELSEDSYQPQFKYNHIFDKAGKVKEFLEENYTYLQDYISKYRDLLSQSTFFSNTITGTSFGTYEAKNILKSIDNNAFFSAGHRFILSDGTEIEDKKELEVVIEKEIKQINEDESLRELFNNIDKRITNNQGLRDFHNIIHQDKDILLYLGDYEDFRKKTWIGFLSQMIPQVDILVDLYESKKADLMDLVSEAQKDINLWEEMIDKFNARFKVPFKIILKNQNDVLLKQDRASIEFYYENGSIAQDKDNLLSVLSRGERRAFFILQFLFELESRKKISEKPQIIILDDIAESFDYKNKFAIIEYIRELDRYGQFKIILLTHNFDFYRTVSSRLNLEDTVYMATSDANRIIKLNNGQYRRDVFSYFLNNSHKNEKIFITLIAFIRNIVEYRVGQKSEDYETLTSCLHYKDNTDDLCVDDILKIFSKHIPKFDQDKFNYDPDQKLISLIYSTADEICNNRNISEIDLENKISLSIAIRLKAECYMHNKLGKFKLESSSNQTRDLFDCYCQHFPNSPQLEILDRVNLMTPENIHVNSFMYEPLIDMSLYHLIELFKDISKLCPNYIGA